MRSLTLPLSAILIGFFLGSFLSRQFTSNLSRHVVEAEMAIKMLDVLPENSPSSVKLNGTIQSVDQQDNSFLFLAADPFSNGEILPLHVSLVPENTFESDRVNFTYIGPTIYELHENQHIIAQVTRFGKIRAMTVQVN